MSKPDPSHEWTWAKDKSRAGSGCCCLGGWQDTAEAAKGCPWCPHPAALDSSCLLTGFPAPAIAPPSVLSREGQTPLRNVQWHHLSRGQVPSLYDFLTGPEMLCTLCPPLLPAETPTPLGDSQALGAPTPQGLCTC